MQDCMPVEVSVFSRGSVRYYQSGQGIGCACDTNLQCIPKTSLHLYTCTSGSALHVLQTLGHAGLA